MEALALHAIHQTLGATFAELRGKEVVRSYAAPLEEYRAATEAAALIDLSARELVRITGEDRLRFLQGMVTNDVERLPVGQALYAAMLTPKGAMVCDARLLRREGELLLDLEPGLGARARGFLGQYLVSEEAELFEASGELGLFSLLGPRAGEAWGQVAKKVEAVELPSLLPGVPGLDLLIPRASLAHLFQELLAVGVRPAGFDTFEVLRVEAQVPRFGQDMDENTIPLEAGLERAISYQKGCYIGQEVIARVSFRGHLNRKLVLLELSFPTGKGETEARPGSELFAGGKKVGWLTSVVRSPRTGSMLALGYLQKSQLEASQPLEVFGGGVASVAGR